MGKRGRTGDVPAKDFAPFVPNHGSRDGRREKRGQMTRRLAHSGVIALGLLMVGAAPVLAGPSAEASARVCAPYLGSANPGPQCMLDIWGYVKSSADQPIANAYVSDGARLSVTDANGFYRLPEDQPNSWRVWVRVQGTDASGSSYWVCQQTTTVIDPNASTVTYGGGARQDFRMSCG